MISAGCSHGTPDATPRFDAVVTCFIGGLDSRSFCSGSSFQLEPKQRFLTGQITCGHLGKVSEIKWTFIEHIDGKDVYEFARVFPVDGDISTTTKKRIAFANERVKIFEDDFQCIVIGPPKK